MKHTEYYQTGKHTSNAAEALKKAVEKNALLKQQRIEEYNLSPTKCSVCDRSLEYRNRKNKFCTKSCAATHNNRLRPPGSASRVTQGVKITGVKKTGKSKKGTSNAKFCKIAWHTCMVCETVFYTKTWHNKRKSCGMLECTTHLKVGYRPYSNGRRKLFRYYNKCTQSEVLLESTWEKQMAEWMDSNSIEWIRPKPIKWYDPADLKTKLYYPDFWLPAIQIYLDPKNPTAMIKDKHKMQIVSKLIDIVYGDLDTLKLVVFQKHTENN